MSVPKGSKYLALVIAAAVLFSMLTCIPLSAQSAEVFSISGYVAPDNALDSGSLDKARKGFAITLSGISSSTCEKGYFLISNIPCNQQEYKIIISKPGYLDREIGGITGQDAVIGTEKEPLRLWAGDVVKDQAINMSDIVFISRYFGMKDSDEKYNIICDLNYDGAINMSDIMITAKNFNKASGDYPAYTPVVTPAATPTPTNTPGQEWTRDLVESGPKDSKNIAFTFEDGYDSSSLERLLDICKSKNIKISIFANSKYIVKNPLIYKRAVTEGHLVLNHTANHISAMAVPSPYTSLDQWIENEVKGWELDVKRVLGEKYFNYMKENFPLFRFPNGDGQQDKAYRDKIIEAGYGAIIGYELAGDVYSGIIPKYDPESYDPRTSHIDMIRPEPIAEKCKEFVLHNVSNGIIFRMENKIFSDLYFAEIIDGVCAKGFKPVSLAELLGHPVTIEPPKLYDETVYPKITPIPGFTQIDPSPQKPFPQHCKYNSLNLPVKVINQSAQDADVFNFYEEWKKLYLAYDPSTDGIYVAANREHKLPNKKAVSTSEGHGYGMMFAALMAGRDRYAKSIYDGMFRFYKSHPSKNNPYLMASEQSIYNGVLKNTQLQYGENSWTVGDVKIAYSLILADRQWGSSGTVNYLQEAKNIINDIMNGEVEKTKWLLIEGNWYDLNSKIYSIRPTDYGFDQLKSFREVTGDERWDNVISKGYKICSEASAKYSPKTGLMPDYLDYNISDDTISLPPLYDCENYDRYFTENVCTLPMVYTTDLLLYKDSPLKDQIAKINSWITERAKKDFAGNANKYPSPWRIYSIYALGGSPCKEDNYMGFTAPFLTASKVGTDQDWLNDLYRYVSTKHVLQSDYYGNTIKLLSMIITTDSYWQP